MLGAFMSSLDGLGRYYPLTIFGYADEGAAVPPPDLEPQDAWFVAAEEFLLFPTVAHSHAERVRPEHQDLLAPAAADSTDNHIVVRAAAKVVAALQVNRPDNIDAIAGRS